MNTAHASVYTDFQGLARLKTAARKDADGALEETARQFEALMMQMMLKSMRQASPGGGLGESDQSLFYRDLYDQQLAIHLAKRGGLGLSEVIQRQLGGGTGGHTAPTGRQLSDYRRQAVARVSPPAATPAEAHTAETTAPSPARPATGHDPAPQIDSPEAFLRHLWPMAREAALQLGQEPDTLLAQAALETGWGQRMIHRDDGNNSFNLFGIKADHRWSGDRAIVPTLEYKEGLPVRQKAAFRAYGSFAESFQDYVAFLQDSPRYRAALQAGDSNSYLTSLQEAGYATDPRYAEKIGAILERPELQRVLAQLKSAEVRP